MELRLIQEEQAPGEPDHWSMFLAQEGQQGAVFQVKGDAIGMHYAHADGVNILDSCEYTYKDSYIISEPDEQQMVRISYWVNSEDPPGAPNQAAVHENCQGWVIRVITRLVSEGIVQQRWLDFAVSIKQPVN